MRSTNPREVAIIFREYVRKIHHKAKPQDPNFLRISVMCGKVMSYIRWSVPGNSRVAFRSKNGASRTTLPLSCWGTMALRMLLMTNERS